MDFISKPTLILDKNKCLVNISKMAQKAESQKIELRPHFKTHQSLEIGNWFRDFGVNKITVSSLSMASYFINGGWQNISIAFPFNFREIFFLDELAGKAELHQTVLSLDSVVKLDKQLKNRIYIWVEVDTGAMRSGIRYDDYNKFDEILEFLKKAEKLNFQGFLTHAGHTYRARFKEEVNFIYNDTVEKLNNLRTRYNAYFPELKISVGDTPSCILVDKLHGIEEMRPGNFVFFDVMQTVIGSCTDEEIALALACPVVAKDSSRNILVVYGGGVHLSKESVILYDGTEIFGRIALPSGKTWGKKLENCYVSSLSQEHGLVTVTKEVFNVISEGELIFILPVHSCLTADLMQGYRLPNGSAIDHMSAKIFKSSK